MDARGRSEAAGEIASGEGEASQKLGGEIRRAKTRIARPVIGIARFNVPIMEIGHHSVKQNLSFPRERTTRVLVAVMESGPKRERGTRDAKLALSR
jgi:hypothetical protein